jgi:hypothetical protein
MTKALLRGNFIIINAYIQKVEKHLRQHITASEGTRKTRKKLNQKVEGKK